MLSPGTEGEVTAPPTEGAAPTGVESTTGKVKSEKECTLCPRLTAVLRD